MKWVHEYNIFKVFPSIFFYALIFKVTFMEALIVCFFEYFLMHLGKFCKKIYVLCDWHNVGRPLAELAV